MLRRIFHRAAALQSTACAASLTSSVLRNTVGEQRATARSASDSVVADDEQEQTSARTVALPTTIVERFTVRIWLYYDDLVVIILSNSTLPL